MANWFRDTLQFLTVSNLKIGDNINLSKHLQSSFPRSPLNNVKVEKLYKISEMCWTPDSQHCFGEGGRGGVYIIDDSTGNYYA